VRSAVTPFQHSLVQHTRVVSRLARIAASSGVMGAGSIARSAQLDDLWAEDFCRQARAFEARQITCDEADHAGGLTVRRTEIDGSPAISFIRDASSDQAAMQDEKTLPSDLLNELCTEHPKSCPVLTRALDECGSGQMSACNDLAEGLAHRLSLFDKAALIYGYACYRKDPGACVQRRSARSRNPLSPQPCFPTGGQPNSLGGILKSRQSRRSCAILIVEVLEGSVHRVHRNEKAERPAGR
jgi:hypothetical protein